MKLAALFSGGKDSTYAIYLAKQLGHTVDVLLTIYPHSDESHLLHYPNIRWTPSQATSMRIPQLIEKLKHIKKMNDGKILVKLIYRETNTTSYEIVKSYRGSFNAFFWQIMAKLWDNNLRTEYDPVNVEEDILIEYILTQANQH